MIPLSAYCSFHWSNPVTQTGLVLAFRKGTPIVNWIPEKPIKSSLKLVLSYTPDVGRTVMMTMVMSEGYGESRSLMAAQKRFPNFKHLEISRPVSGAWHKNGDYRVYLGTKSLEFRRLARKSEDGRAYLPFYMRGYGLTIEDKATVAVYLDTRLLEDHLPDILRSPDLETYYGQKEGSSS